MTYRKYINIVEAANKGCPIATHDLEVNVKNRQTAIDKHHYGPANPDEPGVVDPVITMPGTVLTGGTSPANDILWEYTVDVPGGAITGFTYRSGNPP